MSTNTWIYSAIARALNQGGATINVGDHTSPTTGYQVSIPGHLLKLPSSMPIDEMYPLVAAHVRSDVAPLGNVALGMWEHNGEMYIEPSETVQDRNRALMLGKARGEIAIWDNTKGEEIFTAEQPTEEGPNPAIPVASQPDTWKEEDLAAGATASIPDSWDNEGGSVWRPA